VSNVIIYRYGYPNRGTVLTRAKTRLRFVPRAFFLGGLLGLWLLFLPYLLLEVKYRIGSLSADLPVIGENPEMGFAKVVQASDLAILQPVNPDFSLVIPKIGLNSEIFSNVNPADKDQYKSFLKKGVVHAAGTYLPGENGSVYLFGHSTDFVWNLPQWKAVFYLLRELKEGDKINIFYQDRRYLYEVVAKEIVSPSDLNYLKPRLDEEKIILQTCWPPGTTWKRLLIIARPHNPINIDKRV